MRCDTGEICGVVFFRLVLKRFVSFRGVLFLFLFFLPVSVFRWAVGDLRTSVVTPRSVGGS